MVNRRGQLLLTAAILVSLTIVASAVLLNDIHASADVNAQQERQGLEQTERNIEQLQDSLRELFMVNGSEGRMPYVDDADKLANATEEYVQQYLNVSTQNTVQFVDVTLVGTENGTAIWQNETNSFPENSSSSGSNTPIVGGNPSNITHMAYTITNISGEFIVELGTSSPTGSPTIEIDNGKVIVNGTTKCDGFAATKDTPLNIALTHGTGQISVGDSTCASVTLSASNHTPNNKIFFKNGSNVEGTFDIVVEGSQSTPGESYDGVYDAKNITLNPTFRITYEDPQVSYETNVTAYGGGS